MLDTDPQGRTRIHRIAYEMCMLQVLRDQLRCKELWVVGADRYRNPDDDARAGRWWWERHGLKECGIHGLTTAARGA